MENSNFWNLGGLKTHSNVYVSSSKVDVLQQYSLKYRCVKYASLARL